MKTVAKIIETYGGLAWLSKPGNCIRLENPPYMRLVIEYVGVGPRGMPAISVAHYYEQNGDAMRDPEMVFEVSEAWSPISYCQDDFGIYQEAVICKNGQVKINAKRVGEFVKFARHWDRNIAQQGFLKACQPERNAKP